LKTLTPTAAHTPAAITGKPRPMSSTVRTATRALEAISAATYSVTFSSLRTCPAIALTLSEAPSTRPGRPGLPNTRRLMALPFAPGYSFSM
jgi:hypothetical protein